MAAGADGFNTDFWLGMLTAGPVLLVALSALLPAAPDPLFHPKWARGKWAVRIARVLGGLVFAGSIFAAADLTLTAARSLEARRADVSPSTAVWVLTAVIVLLAIIAAAVAWHTQTTAPSSDAEASRDSAEPSAPDPDQPHSAT